MSRHTHLTAASGVAIVCCLCMTQSSFAGSIVGWDNDLYGEPVTPGGNDFVAIAAGAGHSLALRSDGSLVGWGRGGTPPDGNDFVAIAAGGREPQRKVIVGYGLALKSDGSLVQWGVDDWIPPLGNDFVAIAAGEFHSLALKSDGSIVGWGQNGKGAAVPPAGNGFVAISAGYNNSLAIRRHCQYVLTGDLNDDCRVDFSDFALMAANWLIDCNLNPQNPACVAK